MHTTGRLKMREWKIDTGKIGRVENAGLSRMERQPDIILRQPLTDFVILVLILLTE